ncbi:MAG: hypothetical protein GVY06_01335 [Alphaproteobacteria bacterium]|jgi:uncharacterized membrane protein (Fun14 family)|nr:hypothetical protein [Alphaproteobacteria bacterium]
MKSILSGVIAALATGITVRFMDSWLTELGAAALIGVVTGTAVWLLVKTDKAHKGGHK